MANGFQLGYAGIGTSDKKAWLDIATNILGMQVVPGDEKSTSYLRMDEHHHRLELHSNGSDDLEFVGWEVPDSASLQRVAQRLEDGGVKVTAGTRDEADGRRVIDLIKCIDPSGIPTEVFWGHPVSRQPFLPSRPMSGFKTGDMGLGHILVYTQSIDQSVRFYRDLLGFCISDFSDVTAANGNKVRLAFLHCNPRHHSIAFVEAPRMPTRINHVLIECNSLNDVGTGRDLCLARNIPIVIDLGCHMNDHMVSFYMANPSNFALEYGWGGRIIDCASWQTEHYSAVDSIWGHPQLTDLVNSLA